MPVPVKWKSLLEVLKVSVRLGLTSFGGPVAHLGYFHEEYVVRRRWIGERDYADLVALCQFLPGPSSSQVGIGIGLLRAGLTGGVTAWLGFTLPSVIALVVFAYLMQGWGFEAAGWMHGLKLVAVAIVAQAVWGMGQKLAAGPSRGAIAIGTAAVALLWQTALSQVLLIALAGLVGVFLYKSRNDAPVAAAPVTVNKSTAIACLALFVLLLACLPLAVRWGAPDWVRMFDSFYRSGSLVFGGGHVVLPLLEREVVPAGWVSKEQFLAGYGAAQAIPGPLFTFAAYLGAVAGGLSGALIATVAIFLPAFLLIVGALPFWNAWRSNPRIQGALIGVNAAVVGILLAALYQPIWISAVSRPTDFALVLLMYGMLTLWKLPPWVVVLVGAAGGALAG
ncbi:chromate transporter [Paenibacillus allorhizosphaerae]|uniref:Chromate transport protein n=1 Tax=Paenibacillus allorhizosphaerae TaxID=2849866 RepID=A0ABM8VHR1_9BACL|nr:chromate transporter [Paenibacillus allorhizosphaerae]CAG7642738.1 Chromate transport protein [Paenibacillus allorhizosphaerae]